MRYTLEVNIDDDVLRASGMRADKFVSRTMRSLQEYGIRVIEPQEPVLDELHSAPEQAPEDRKETYYFSFGTADYFPFKLGWVEVRANSREEACEMFASHYPCRSDSMLNCSFVYNESAWKQTSMSQGGPGQVCHRVIDTWGPHRDVPSKGLGDLMREAKERLGSRDGTKNSTKQKQPPQQGR
ncbi:MAG: hypothetical protein ACI37P_07815 [Eggerthellaceae bacterium]